MKILISWKYIHKELFPFVLTLVEHYRKINLGKAFGIILGDIFCELIEKIQFLKKLIFKTLLLLFKEIRRVFWKIAETVLKLSPNETLYKEQSFDVGVKECSKSVHDILSLELVLAYEVVHLRHFRCLFKNDESYNLCYCAMIFWIMFIGFCKFLYLLEFFRNK